MNSKNILPRAALFLLVLLGCNFLQPTPELTPTPLPATPTNIPTNTLAPTNTPLPPTATPYPLTIVQKGAEMVLVPAGEFIMGSDTSEDYYEKPQHTVYLDTFYIDKYEVTNALYKACVKAGVCDQLIDSSSPTRSSYYGNPEFDNYPVIYVSWDMAEAYCKWRGAQLPTEAQWEKAARGTDGRTYPWGEEEIDNTYANYGTYGGDTSPVGSYEKGKSVYGVYDMVGIGWEWVADWWSDTYYENSPSSNPLGPSSGILGVKRGGRTYTRNGDIRGGQSPFISFRCASSPPTSASNAPSVDGNWQPVTFTIPDWNEYWEQSLENGYTAKGGQDTFIWTDEVYEGNLALSFDLEIVSSESEPGGGGVIVFGDGREWSKGVLVFFINAEYQSIHADTIFGDQDDLAHNTISLENNRTYSFTIEILDDKALLFLDGEKIVSATLPTRINRSGQIGLYKYWAVPEVTFSNIEVKVPSQ